MGGNPNAWQHDELLIDMGMFGRFVSMCILVYNSNIVKF